MKYIREVIDFEYLKIDRILVTLFPDHFEFDGVFQTPKIPVEIGVDNGNIFQNLS